MKNTFLLLILLVGVSLMNACTPKNNCTISGTLTGLTDGTVLELLPGATQKKEQPLAETTVSGGKFSFTVQAPTPRLFYINQQGIKGTLTVVTSNGEQVDLTGTVKYTELNGKRQADFSAVQISGSSTHSKYSDLMSFTEVIRKQEKEFTKKHKALSDSCMAAVNAGNQVLADSIWATPAYATLLQDLKTIFRNTENYIRNAILTNKDTEWGPLLMLVTVNWFENKHREWFATFSPEAQKSYYGQILYKELYPETLEGKIAPAFSFQADDQIVHLQSLLTGKKYLLIDFWASWCDPCRREIPHLKKLYKKFAPKGLEIISISIDKDEKAWKKASEEEQFPWPNFLHKNGIDEAYGVRAIPAIFLVDSTGIVTYASVGGKGESLAQKIAELLP